VGIRVPADANIREREGGGLTDTRSVSKMTEVGSQCFERSDSTSRAQRR